MHLNVDINDSLVANGRHHPARASKDAMSKTADRVLGVYGVVMSHFIGFGQYILVMTKRRSWLCGHRYNSPAKPIRIPDVSVLKSFSAIVMDWIGIDAWHLLQRTSMSPFWAIASAMTYESLSAKCDPLGTCTLSPIVGNERNQNSRSRSNVIP